MFGLLLFFLRVFAPLREILSSLLSYLVSFLPRRNCHRSASHGGAGAAIDVAHGALALEYPASASGEQDVAAEDERQDDGDDRDDFQESGDGQLFKPHDRGQQREEENCGLWIRQRER